MLIWIISDISVAFDTLDRAILINYPETRVAITGSARDNITSSVWPPAAIF